MKQIEKLEQAVAELRVALKAKGFGIESCDPCDYCKRRDGRYGCEIHPSGCDGFKEFVGI